MNQIVTFNQSEADAIAEKYFIAMCGFNRPGERFKTMLRDGLAIRDQLAASFRIRAVVSSFTGEAIRESCIQIGQLKFACNAIEQIDGSGVVKLFAYILTIGNLDYESDSVLNMFYADSWGTAYVDAGRDLLRAWLQKEIGTVENAFISDSFGPGYYGMDMDQLQGFFQLLDAESIDVRLSNSTMMLPLKSCAGFYLAVKEPSQLPGEDCKSCLAEAKGCSFCRVNNNRA